MLVHHFVLGIKRFASFELFQHVVHPGQRQISVLALLSFSMRIDLFGETTDPGFKFRS